MEVINKTVQIENFDAFTQVELRVRERLQRKFKRKQLIGRNFYKVIKLKEFQDKLRGDNKETMIITALEIITLCVNSFDDLCKIHFNVNPT